MSEQVSIREGYEGYVKAFTNCVGLFELYVKGHEDHLKPHPKAKEWLKMCIDFHDGVKDEFLNMEWGKDFPLIRRILKGDYSKETLKRAYASEALCFGEELKTDVEIAIGRASIKESINVLKEVA